MPLARKLERWDGVNKSKTRQQKLNLVRHAVASNFIFGGVKALTLAGSQAHFERGLVRQQLARPENIVTVQTCGRHGSTDGADVLRCLIGKRDEYLPGMYIWPDTLGRFATNYTPEKGRIYTGPRRLAGYRHKPIDREMDRFIGLKPPAFNVLDIDICGIFNRANAETISELMRKAMAGRGLLFINHQKGRDGRFGRLFKFVREYFHDAPFDIDSIDGLDLSCDDALTYDLIRRIAVPAYYTCEAYKHGYTLSIDRFTEYRDRNPDSGKGVNMFQWCFRFTRHTSQKHQNSAVKYTKALAKEKSDFRQNLGTIAREVYPFTELIDE